MLMPPRRRLHTALIALAICGLLLAGGALPAAAADPLWTESQGASAPPEIARLNELMHSLAERLKPALVQVRVRRPAGAASEETAPHPLPDEPRRTSGSGSRS